MTKSGSQGPDTDSRASPRPASRAAASRRRAVSVGRSFSMSLERVMVTGSSSTVLRSRIVRHTGQCVEWSTLRRRHARQKEWPHGVVTGSCMSSWHTVHSSASKTSSWIRAPSSASPPAARPGDARASSALMARTKPSATRRRSESASTIIIVVDREGRVFLLFRRAARGERFGGKNRRLTVQYSGGYNLVLGRASRRFSL